MKKEVEEKKKKYRNGKFLLFIYKNRIHNKYYAQNIVNLSKK